MGNGLSMPGTLSGQSGELKDINARLYDYLQILLWVWRNNYDNYDNYDCGDDQGEGWEPGNRKLEAGNHKPGNCKPGMRNGEPGNGKLANRKLEKGKSENCKAETGSYRFGNGLLGNRRLRNYDDSGSCKPRNHDSRNGDVGNHDSELRNREVGLKALDGCLEIVGLPDGNEMILANNINGEGVDRLVRDAMVLKARKERLVGRMGKDVALLEKRYASYESSHSTLRTLQVFGGLACGIVVIFGLVFFRLR
jgi:hypothetical protein